MGSTSLIDLAKRANAKRQADEMDQAATIDFLLPRMEVGETRHFAPLQHETLAEAEFRLKPLLRQTALRAAVPINIKLDGPYIRVRRLIGSHTGKFAEFEELGVGHSSRIFEYTPRDTALEECRRIARKLADLKRGYYRVFEMPRDAELTGVFVICVGRGDAFCYS